MPQEKIENLILELRAIFGDSEPSVAQSRMLEGLKQHIHPEDAVLEADPELIDTLESLYQELKEEHPKITLLFQETIVALKNMGV